MSDYFRDNPDVPIIKVVPPQGYRPRSTEYPIDLRIDTPIQQNVSRGRFAHVTASLSLAAALQVLNHTNRAGFYDCVLMAKPVRCVSVVVTALLREPHR